MAYVVDTVPFCAHFVFFFLDASACACSVKVIPLQAGQFSLPGFTITSPSKHLPLLPSTSAPSVYVFPSKAPPPQEGVVGVGEAQ